VINDEDVFVRKVRSGFLEGEESIQVDIVPVSERTAVKKAF
jgi:hypothetical protein